jgi:hypothetical protein
VVLSRRATTLVPALLVPDEQTWTMAGRDPVRLGFEPVAAPAAAQRVLVLDGISETLQRALDEVVDTLPPDVRPFGHRAHHREEHHGGEQDHGHHGNDDGHADHGNHDAHGGHGGHDHHDMMAIVGEPSADGLVMEPIELELGPLVSPLPGGIVVAVTLDGDVVAECDVSATLVNDGASAPDALAPASWRVALSTARELAEAVPVAASDRWARVAAVEVERALSHTAWLRALGRLLGWPELVARTSRAVAALTDAADPVSVNALRAAQGAVARVAALLDDSRRLRVRTAGRAHITHDRALALGLRGPLARACGLRKDARLGDPLYERLGFEPVVREEGDALARTLVRADEAVVSVGLAVGALEASGGRSDPLPVPRSPAVVEGPRGPLQAVMDSPEPTVAALGHDAALSVAGKAAVGSEWAAALVGLASFDLSPWKIRA